MTETIDSGNEIMERELFLQNISLHQLLDFSLFNNKSI